MWSVRDSIDPSSSTLRFVWGSGSRLWPQSRAGFSKQFLSLSGKESLFQQAAQRLSVLGDSGIDVAKPIIVTG